MIEGENGKRKRREINGERKHAQEEGKRGMKGAERGRKRLAAASPVRGRVSSDLYS